jgi:hypothetical protein
MNKILILFVVLVTFFFSSICLGGPLQVFIEKRFENQNWYPLSKKDMEAATTDTALAKLTESGLFAFTKNSQMSHLNLHVSLVERAELVKITITLDLVDGPTYVAVASGSIRDKDFQGIYKVFEKVGAQAASDLNAIMRESNKISHAVIKQTSNYDNKRAQSMYEQAQILKREKKYLKSKILFEKISRSKDPGSNHWKNLSIEELKYGLPNFEADQLFLSLYNLTDNADQLSNTCDKIESLYRYIIENNKGNFQRTLEFERKIDALKMSRETMQKAIAAETVSRLSGLRIACSEFYFSMGRYPTLSEFQGILSDMRLNYKIASFNSNYTDFTVKLSASNGAYVLKGDNKGEFRINKFKALNK